MSHDPEREALKDTIAIQASTIAKLRAELAARPSGEAWRPVEITDEMALDIRKEAELACARAMLDAEDMGMTYRDGVEVADAAWAETLRSYLYQAGVLPAPPPATEGK